MAIKNEGLLMNLRKRVVLIIYNAFLMVPIYWLINMSFKSNTEILGGLTLWPQGFTLENYRVIFTDRSWYSGYINSLYYVCLNTIISLAVALPPGELMRSTTPFTCASSRNALRAATVGPSMIWPSLALWPSMISPARW